MSAALVRQALEFVDPDENKTSGKRKRGGRSRGIAGQERVTQIEEELGTKNKSKQTKSEGEPRDTEEVISKLLRLSESKLDKDISEKIVKRTVTGKPVFDEVVVKHEEPKSILFPEDDPPEKKKKKKKRTQNK